MRHYCHDLDSNNNNNARSSGGVNLGGENKGIKDCRRTIRGTGITTQRYTTTNKQMVQQEVEPPAERRREATGQHNNQPNKRGAKEQQEADVPAEGFGKAERAADNRSSQ
jgi:hypothetical protein